jgi:hypothetical protein
LKESNEQGENKFKENIQMKEKQIEEFNSKIDYLQDQLQNREKLVGDEVSY